MLYLSRSLLLVASYSHNQNYGPYVNKMNVVFHAWLLKSNRVQDRELIHHRVNGVWVSLVSLVCMKIEQKSAKGILLQHVWHD